MKCVKNIQTGQVRRVSDHSAENLVGPAGTNHPSSFFVYCPKSEWKKKVRDFKPESTPAEG